MSVTHDLVQRFLHDRQDGRTAVIEGYHALKHALRFGADILEVVVADDVDRTELPPEAAPIEARRVSRSDFERLVPRMPPLAVVARARRPTVDGGQLLASPTGASATVPAVLLERPTHLGNVGAAVRVVAAAGAACLVTTGRNDPWNPAAIRGSAGLHFAVPVARVDDVPPTPRQVVAFDPAGTPFPDAEVEAGALLAFGTERRGLSAHLLDVADAVVRIPMRPRVSSLNLATSVAVALYAHPGWRAGSSGAAESA